MRITRHASEFAGREGLDRRVDEDIERAYALATHEVVHRVKEGAALDTAVAGVIADPAFRLGLNQISRLRREAADWHAEYRKQAAAMALAAAVVPR